MRLFVSKILAVFGVIGDSQVSQAGQPYRHSLMLCGVCMFGWPRLNSLHSFSTGSGLLEFRLDSPQRGALTEVFRLCESASSRAEASRTWSGRRTWSFGRSN